MITALAGQPAPLGATVVDGGVNFSLFSRTATGVELLLFEQSDDAKPTRTVGYCPIANHTYHYWHAFVPGVKAGQLYGYRVSGPAEPDKGLRFDSNKLPRDIVEWETAPAMPAGAYSVGPRSIVMLFKEPLKNNFGVGRFWCERTALAAGPFALRQRPAASAVRSLARPWQNTEVIFERLLSYWAALGTEVEHDWNSTCADGCKNRMERIGKSGRCWPSDWPAKEE